MIRGSAAAPTAAVTFTGPSFGVGPIFIQATPSLDVTFLVKGAPVLGVTWKSTSTGFRTGLRNLSKTNAVALMASPAETGTREGCSMKLIRAGSPGFT